MPPVALVEVPREFLTSPRTWYLSLEEADKAGVPRARRRHVSPKNLCHDGEVRMMGEQRYRKEGFRGGVPPSKRVTVSMYTNADRLSQSPPPPDQRQTTFVFWESTSRRVVQQLVRLIRKNHRLYSYHDGKKSNSGLVKESVDALWS